ARGRARRLAWRGGGRRARGVAPGGPPARTGVGEPHGTSAGVATGPSPRRAGASVERAASGDRVGSERPRSRRRPAAARTQIPITHARRVTSPARVRGDRKSTRLNSSHVKISYAVFCLNKKHLRKI